MVKKSEQTNDIQKKMKAMIKKNQKMQSTQVSQSNQPVNNTGAGKVVAVIIVIIFLFFIIKGCSNNPTFDIQDDIRAANFSLGYGTKYQIGKVDRVSCSEYDSDGNGRYIISCSVTYYAKRRNGTTDMTSTMKETVYAAYMKRSNDYLRRYTSYISDTFKRSICWGQDKSKGLICS